MTFTKFVKNELVTIPIQREEMVAEFLAFLNFGCEFHIENNKKMIDFITKNPTISKRFLMLSKTLYQSDVEILKQIKKTFSKKPLVILRLTSNVEQIIQDYDYLEEPVEKIVAKVRKKEEKIAFLRASFVVSGSINDPKSSEYHLEIFAEKTDEIIFIQKLMNEFNLNAKITKRRKGYIVYLKNADSISDFMQLIGAINAVFKFEDIRIKKDFNNSINRIINCEIANEKKVVVSAENQLNDINLILKHYKHLKIDEKILRIINLRKNNPNANLRELCEIYFEKHQEKLSKSGLNHRFIKIKDMANKIREEKDDSWNRN